MAQARPIPCAAAVTTAVLFFSRSAMPLSSNTPAPAPAQPRQGPILRPILGADPAAIADLVKEIEQKSEIDLPLARLVPSRHIGDLHMRIAAFEVTHMLREIALADLAMI